MDYKHLVELFEEMMKGPTLEELTKEVAGYLSAVALNGAVDPSAELIELGNTLVEVSDYEELIKDDTFQAVAGTISALAYLGYITLNEDY